MLNAFRQQGLTSAVYGVLIVATVVVFIIQFRPGAQGRSGSIKQECAAEIRGRCIEPKEYQAELMLVAPGRIIEASQLQGAGHAASAVLDGSSSARCSCKTPSDSGSRSPKKSSTTSSSTGAPTSRLPVERARCSAIRCGSATTWSGCCRS